MTAITAKVTADMRGVGLDERSELWSSCCEADARRQAVRGQD